MDWDAKLDEDLVEDARRVDWLVPSDSKCPNGGVSNYLSTTNTNKERSIVRVQKFINKLRRFTSPNEADALFNEIQKIDVGMHLSEISDAVADGSFRIRDVNRLSQVLVVISRDHPEFSSLFSDSMLQAHKSQSKALWKFAVTAASSAIAGDANASAPHLLFPATSTAIATDVSNFVTRRRAACRLVTELGLVRAIPQEVVADFVELLTLNDFFGTDSPAARFGTRQVAREVMMTSNASVLEIMLKKTGIQLTGEFDRELPTSLRPKFESLRVTLDRHLQERIRRSINQFVDNFGGSLLKDLESAMIQQESANLMLKVNKGRIDAEHANRYETIKINLSRLQTSIRVISNAVNAVPIDSRPSPDGMHTDSINQVTRLNEGGEAKTTAPVPQEELSPWEDNIEKAFYEDILDLRTVVPGALLGTRAPGAPVPVCPNETICVDRTNDPPGASDERMSSGSGLSPPVSPLLASVPDPPVMEEGAVDPVEGLTSQAAMQIFLVEMSRAAADEAGSGWSTGESMDKMAVEYFYRELNTKGNRKKLIRHFLGIRRVDIHLLPPYGRFVATIAAHCPDVKQSLVEASISEFKELVADKSPVRIEAKIKSSRVVAELCKFGLMPPGAAMDLFSLCLEDFTSHHIEMACHLAQGCGRFLIAGFGTKLRFQILLDRLLRLSVAKVVPVELEVLVQDTYYRIRPAKSASGRATKSQDLPVMQRFIHKLIFEDLVSDQEEKISKIIRRLNWKDQNTHQWLKDSILELEMSVNYDRLDCFASLLTALARYRPGFVLDVVDQLTECIQLSMERCDFREAPRRVRQAKLFAELYNYCLIDSSVLLDQLYHFIGFGGPTAYEAGHIGTAHKLLQYSTTSAVTVGTRLAPVAEEAEENSTGLDSQLPALGRSSPLIHPASPEDPWWDYIRVKLVCVILDAVGRYFKKGLPKLKMDRFLLFFQRYILLHKGQTLPTPIIHLIDESFVRLRPKLKRFTTLDEATFAVQVRLADESQLLLRSGDGEEMRDEGFGRCLMEGSSDDQSSSVGSSESYAYDEGVEDVDDEDDEYPVDEDRAFSRQDEEFDRELARLVVDSLDQARMVPNSYRRPEIKLPPSNIVARKSSTQLGKDSTGESKLRVVTRKGPNRFEIKQIDVPKSSRLWQALEKKDAEDFEDRQKLKRFVLDSVDRSHNEEVAQTQRQLVRQMFTTRPNRGERRRGFRR